MCGAIVLAMPKGLTAALRSWIEQFPVDDVRARIEELETERAEITQELDELRTNWDMWQRLMKESRYAGAGNAAAHEEPPPAPRSLSRRAAAMMLLEESPHRAFPLGEVYARLVNEGLLDAGADTYHGLQVALATAVKKGHVQRVRPGVYQIARNGDKAPTLTNFQSEDGDGS